MRIKCLDTFKERVSTIFFNLIRHTYKLERNLKSGIMVKEWYNILMALCYIFKNFTKEVLWNFTWILFLLHLQDVLGQLWVKFGAIVIINLGLMNSQKLLRIKNFKIERYLQGNYYIVQDILILYLPTVVPWQFWTKFDAVSLSRAGIIPSKPQNIQTFW